MDIIDENKYNEFKNILLGCKNINDAEYFADLYTKKNPETKKLVMALLHGKKYFCNYKDFRSMQKIMEKCDECQNQDDAMEVINEYFADLYTEKSSETKKSVMALLHGKKHFCDYKDFRSMQKIMEKCNECPNQDDSMEGIKEYYFRDKNGFSNDFRDSNKDNNDIQYRTLLLSLFDSFKDNNNVQYRTLMRIAKNKKAVFEKDPRNRPPFMRKDKSNSLVVKYCPHSNCGKPYRGTNETKYVICGYENDHRGYDWVGCRQDWCFACGKMLCKLWEKHQLDVDCNRIHDSECCKKHAVDNKRIYLTDYCQCENKYTKRSLHRA